MTASTNPQEATGLQIYLRILQYMKPLWVPFIVSILGFIIFAATQPLFPKLMELIINAVETQDYTARYTLPFLAVGIFIIRGIGSFIGSYYMAYVSGKLVNSLRFELYKQLTVLPASYYDTNPKGQTLQRLTGSVGLVTGAATNAIKIIVREGMTVICLLAFVFYTNWQLSITFLFIAPFIYLIISYTSKRFRNLTKKTQLLSGSVIQAASEMISAFHVVRIFGGQQHENQRYSEAVEENFKQGMKMAKISSIATPVLQLVIACAIAGIVFLVLQPQFLESSTTGELVGYLIAVGLLPKPIRQLSEVNIVIQKGISGALLVFELLDANPEPDFGVQQASNTTGKLNFQNVSFSYDENKQVLKDISFEVLPGQTVALVGRSGSGKSTLVNLIPRFYSPNSGTITLDDVNVESLTLESLRQQLSIVNQNVILFNDSLKNNIAYGRLKEKSEEEFANALKQAHAKEFIDELENGLETSPGDNGLQLSGGQRQRIAIARALLKNAPILILDEATSALDNESERIIQDALEHVMEGRTTLVIAHRLSTVENADKILVMDKGCIVESGTHSELLQENGVYTSLHSQEFVD